MTTSQMYNSMQGSFEHSKAWKTKTTYEWQENDEFEGNEKWGMIFSV